MAKVPAAYSRSAPQWVQPNRRTLPVEGVGFGGALAAWGGFHGLGGQEAAGDGRIGVLGPGGLGERLVGDDPRLRFGRHVRPVPVSAGLG